MMMMIIWMNKDNYPYLWSYHFDLCPEGAKYIYYPLDGDHAAVTWAFRPPPPA
jgi:hypothetical protein